jgi:hypothetical protein
MEVVGSLRFVDGLKVYIRIRRNKPFRKNPFRNQHTVQLTDISTIEITSMGQEKGKGKKLRT